MLKIADYIDTQNIVGLAKKAAAGTSKEGGVLFKQAKNQKGFWGRLDDNAGRMLRNTGRVVSSRPGVGKQVARGWKRAPGVARRAVGTALGGNKEPKAHNLGKAPGWMNKYRDEWESAQRKGYKSHKDFNKGLGTGEKAMGQVGHLLTGSNWQTDAPRWHAAKEMANNSDLPVETQQYFRNVVQQMDSGKTFEQATGAATKALPGDPQNQAEVNRRVSKRRGRSPSAQSGGKTWDNMSGKEKRLYQRGYRFTGSGMKRPNQLEAGEETHSVEGAQGLAYDDLDENEKELYQRGYRMTNEGMKRPDEIAEGEGVHEIEGSRQLSYDNLSESEKYLYERGYKMTNDGWKKPGEVSGEETIAIKGPSEEQPMDKSRQAEATDQDQGATGDRVKRQEGPTEARKAMLRERRGSAGVSEKTKPETQSSQPGRRTPGQGSDSWKKRTSQSQQFPQSQQPQQNRQPATASGNQGKNKGKQTTATERAARGVAAKNFNPYTSDEMKNRMGQYQMPSSVNQTNNYFDNLMSDNSLGSNVDQADSLDNSMFDNSLGDFGFDSSQLNSNFDFSNTVV